MVEPELFYMPVKKKEPEPMIIKILVTDIENVIGISFDCSNISINYEAFKYTDMEQEYSETGVVKTDATGCYLHLYPYYNLKIKDKSKVVITDDIDYFRNAYNDCLYKPHSEEISQLIYSKCCSFEPLWCEIDWGDGTTENINDIIEHYEDEVISYDCITFNYNRNIKKHIYSKPGEYYIKIEGNIPSLQFSKGYYLDETYANCLPILEEVVQWGNLGLYSIQDLFYIFYYEYKAGRFQSLDIKFPKHVSSDSFKKVLTASRAFCYLNISENDISQEIIFDFANTFPNLLSAYSMFYGCNISYIPKYFCYNHKNILSCACMFYDNPITIIEERAFANCINLTTVEDLTHSSGYPYLTRVEDSIFENDHNLVEVFAAFNYVNSDYIHLLYSDENYGLKTVGNNIYKNCKRLRRANEPFYQQTGLVSVGESLFEGCEDLIKVDYCFYGCWSLQQLGDNIFKGCSKIRMFQSFCNEDYFVNYPDKMFYDLKYYNYLKNSFNFNSFSGYWLTISENNGIISENSNEGLTRFLRFKNYSHNNFPTRKHSKDIFSEDFLNDCIANGDNFVNKQDLGLFNSMISFNNKVSDDYEEYYHISNFTGEAFPLWKYNGLKYITNTFNNLFGFRNIKIKRTYKQTLKQVYGVTINNYDNYIDIATAEPIICIINPAGYKNYYTTSNILLDTYYYPDEYDNEYEKQEVIEFNDPVKYEYIQD